MALPQAWNYRASKASTKPPRYIPEICYPILYQSNNIGSTGGNVSASGQNFIWRGKYNSIQTTMKKIFTLPATSNPNDTYAFEAVMYCSGNGSQVVYLALWDVTANAIVPGSTLSTNTSVPTLFRSGTIQLTPGHDYGITGWITNTVGTGNDASFADFNLIIFPS